MEKFFSDRTFREKSYLLVVQLLCNRFIFRMGIAQRLGTLKTKAILTILDESIFTMC